MKHQLSELEKADKQKKKEEKLRKLESIKFTNEKIFNMLFVEDELSWKDLIYSLIESEQMNPWDIDVSQLSNKFLEMLKTLKELDFRVSGKMVLASAILLKMKSDILIDQDIANFDNMMNATEENMPLDDSKPIDTSSKPNIFPKTPQPRQRKVSVYDLVNALEKALEVEFNRKRFHINGKKTEISIPEKKFDIGKAMVDVYNKIEKHYSAKKTRDKTLTFDDLVFSKSKKDKVLTFVPLLHLDTQRKVDLEQEKHFDTIAVKLTKKEDNNTYPAE
jgi:segregation and condensation protein A